VTGQPSQRGSRSGRWVLTRLRGPARTFFCAREGIAGGPGRRRDWNFRESRAAWQAFAAQKPVAFDPFKGAKRKDKDGRASPLTSNVKARRLLPTNSFVKIESITAGQEREDVSAEAGRSDDSLACPRDHTSHNRFPIQGIHRNASRRTVVPVAAAGRY
jgi:hypothetical protein